jgi:hypothetical protein
MQRRIQKYRHASGTALFLLSTGYLFILALRQAGAQWWLIFSLSGPSIIFAFILTSIYLLAIYRGAVRSNQPSEVEHPFTSSSPYMIFYDISPFLGGLGAVVGMIGTSDVKEYFVGVAYGTLVATFLVWIILDPTIGLLENLMPASRRHRQRRLVAERKAKQQKQFEREKLLEEVQAEEKRKKMEWENLLQPHAIELAKLVSSCKSDRQGVEGIAVDIGVNAWRSGGLTCMELLHQMAQEHKEVGAGENGREDVDYISQWWDGIGQWHHQPYSTRG